MINANLLRSLCKEDAYGSQYEAAVSLESLNDFISENAIEFDNDGWCWDMEKAQKCRVFGWDGNDLKICRVQRDIEGNYCSASYYKRLIAWRPLSAIPTFTYKVGEDMFGVSSD